MSESFGSRRWFAVLASFLGLTVLLAPLCADEADKRAGDAYAVPDGTPEELLAFIKRLQRPQRESGSRAERMAKRKQAAAAIVAAADRILESQGDDATAAAALLAELDTLPLLGRLGDKQAEAKLAGLVEKYQDDARPAVAQAVRLRGLTRRFDELERAAGQPDAEQLKKLLATVKENLGAGEVNDTTAGHVVRAARLVLKLRAQDLAAEQFPELARLLAKAHDAKFVSIGAELARVAADQFAQAGRANDAIGLYQEFIAILKEKDDPLLAARIEQLEGALRALDMVGHPLDIAGSLVDGGQIDWAEYKGKVVLVDFWATWCGPCLAELPNVKQTYEKYHEQGFDVVGISLDDNRLALESFLKKEKLAWPILFSDDPNATGWKHPLATKYGVNSIPRAILVDRQGNVATLSARGEALGEMVAKLLEN